MAAKMAAAWPLRIPKICKNTSNFLNNDDRVIILVPRGIFTISDPLKPTKTCTMAP